MFTQNPGEKKEQKEIAKLQAQIRNLSKAKNNLLSTVLQLQKEKKEDKPLWDKKINDSKNERAQILKKTLIWKDVLPRKISVPITNLFYPSSIPKAAPNLRKIGHDIREAEKLNASLQGDLYLLTRDLEKVTSELIAAKQSLKQLTKDGSIEENMESQIEQIESEFVMIGGDLEEQYEEIDEELDEELDEEEDEEEDEEQDEESDNEHDKEGEMQQAVPLLDQNTSQEQSSSSLKLGKR